MSFEKLHGSYENSSAKIVLNIDQTNPTPPTFAGKLITPYGSTVITGTIGQYSLAFSGDDQEVITGTMTAINGTNLWNISLHFGNSKYPFQNFSLSGYLTKDAEDFIHLEGPAVSD